MRPANPQALRAFVAVAREGNVSRAAERLNLSQPAVSLQLKALADLTGLELFARTATGMTLTRDGAALLPQAERALAALMDFSQAAARVTGSVRGRLRIGTILDPEFTRLGAFLRELVGVAPELEPELHQGMSGQVLAQLARGELDVGYFLGDPNDLPQPPGRSTTRASARSGRFQQQVLTRFTYRVIAPPGWGPQVQGRDWAALARLPWIGTPPLSAHHRLLGRIFGGLGVQQNCVAMVDQEASMLALVRSGVGLSLCRDSIAMRESESEGMVVADRVSVETTLNFVCLEQHAAAPAVQCAWDALARAWQW